MLSVHGSNVLTIMIAVAFSIKSTQKLETEQHLTRVCNLKKNIITE